MTSFPPTHPLFPYGLVFCSPTLMTLSTRDIGLLLLPSLAAPTPLRHHVFRSPPGYFPSFPPYSCVKVEVSALLAVTSRIFLFSRLPLLFVQPSFLCCICTVGREPGRNRMVFLILDFKKHNCSRFHHKFSCFVYPLKFPNLSLMEDGCSPFYSVPHSHSTPNERPFPSPLMPLGYPLAGNLSPLYAGTLTF